ncbi:hypothetical protein ACFFJ7_18240 [Pseudochelatococcus lubricantis]|uniref:hypothetical protein n=1 Tax=Pseudochelatococcus lubricantis TaxID=1538102 RepID=UPI0035EA5D03
MILLAHSSHHLPRRTRAQPPSPAHHHIPQVPFDKQCDALWTSHAAHRRLTRAPVENRRDSLESLLEKKEHERHHAGGETARMVHFDFPDPARRTRYGRILSVAAIAFRHFIETPKCNKFLILRAFFTQTGIHFA